MADKLKVYLMKNLKSIFTLTSLILFAIPVTNYLKSLMSNNSKQQPPLKQYDLSLRNFHPNKGE